MATVHFVVGGFCVVVVLCAIVLVPRIGRKSAAPEGDHSSGSGVNYV